MSEQERLNAEIKMLCAELVTAFAYHVDHRNFAQAVDVFAVDGVFERPDMTARGHEQLAAIWAGRPDTVVTRHLCHSTYFLEVGPDSARAVTSFTLYHTTRDSEGLPTVSAPTAIAEFHDEFSNTPQGWKIAHRRSVPVLLGEH